MSVIDFGIKRPDDFSPLSDKILEKAIIPQFELIVEKYPERAAIRSSTHSLSYRELNNAINHLTHQIIQELGDDKSPVAFLLGNEVLSIIVLMAVLKSGRPYAGLHPSNSNAQLKAYLEDSTASLLITSAAFNETIKNIQNDRNPVRVLYFDEIKTDINNKNPEYKGTRNDPFGIFYTSGSTGKPKGVLDNHGNKLRNAQNKINEWFFSPSDHISLVTSVCFGASYTSMLGALLSGALLLVFDLKANTAQKTLDWMLSEELTIFQCTPSIFRTIFSSAPKGLIFSKLRLINMGGEPVTETDVELLKAHTAKDCVLINNFGATESGSICHYPVHHCTPPFRGFLPAGYAAPDREVLLLDDEGQAVQDGEEGEIVVRSRFLSPGYWRQPELTAQKFYTDPHDPNIRVYYTGDRGRWRKDGVLETLGRKDAQVKIRGFRVQLDAIDLALRNLDGVKDAATIVHQPSDRGERLVAYLVPAYSDRLSTSQLRDALSRQLPDYMVPSTFIWLDTMPQTTTGKVNRKELPAPSNARPELETLYVAPEKKMEVQIASIWQSILDLERVGIEDNFFELGGDSLMALEMTLEVETALSRTVPAAFFKQPTISFLTTLLEANNQTEANKEKFILESYKKDIRFFKTQNTRKIATSALKKLVTKKYSLNDFDRLVDLLIARYIVTKSYMDANQWIVKWSQNAFARDFLYQRRYALFARWVASLKDCHIQPSAAFQMNLLTNMNFGLTRYLDGNQKIVKSDLQAYKRSPYPYWRTLGELLDVTPAGQLNDHFFISGLDNLTQAYQQGKGVILLSFHGTPAPGRFFALERFLNVDHIPTLSYRIPIRQSQYDNDEDQMSEAVASTLNAEIALFGQRKLQEGKIINIVSDTSDMHGIRYEIALGGRDYQIKGGFAELALHTGAKIIPYFGSTLANGCSQFNLLPPLDPGSGDHEEKINRLIQEYTAFINHVWVTRPEVLRWSRIDRHFSQSVAGE